MEGKTPQRYSAQQFLDALELTGRLLEERGAQFEIVVIGGANLAIQRIVQRLTVDVDVVAIRDDPTTGFVCAKPLPPELEAVVADVAEIRRFPARWMNGECSSGFGLGLPDGFDDRLHTMTFGGLTVARRPPRHRRMEAPGRRGQSRRPQQPHRRPQDTATDARGTCRVPNLVRSGGRTRVGVLAKP